jgi:membrane-associated phospholipid phosphatase
MTGPSYLEEGVRSGTAYWGGGVSAMPSMHIAAAILYLLAARRTFWFIPACLFAVIIFVGSIHSGYHYAVDGIVAAAIACACWRASGVLFQRFGGQDNEADRGGSHLDDLNGMPKRR